MRELAPKAQKVGRKLMFAAEDIVTAALHQSGPSARRLDPAGLSTAALRIYASVLWRRAREQFAADPVLAQEAEAVANDRKRARVAKAQRRLEREQEKLKLVQVRIKTEQANIVIAEEAAARFQEHLALVGTSGGSGRKHASTLKRPAPGTNAAAASAPKKAKASP
jgi:hypothetical protein